MQNKPVNKKSLFNERVWLWDKRLNPHDKSTNPVYEPYDDHTSTVIEILHNFNYDRYNIKEIHLWSYHELLKEIPNYPWLVKHIPLKNPSILKELFWQYFIFRSLKFYLSVLKILIKLMQKYIL